MMDLSHLLSDLRVRFDINSFRDREKGSGRDKTRLQIEGAATDLFWADTFHNIFLEKSSDVRDDLLFVVRWNARESCEQVEVFRKDTNSLPSRGDETVLWEQTLYLNLILHEFEYYVTCGVVTVKDGVVDTLSKRIQQRVYPSPSQRRMDKKESVSDVVYPNVVFCVDNFEDAFSELYSQAPGEKIAVQLMAVNKVASVNQLVFLGAVDHATLKDAYDARDRSNPSTFSSKLKKLTLKTRHSRVCDLSTPYQFVRMRGPHMKGFAEVAIWKQCLSLSKLEASSLSFESATHSKFFFGSGQSPVSSPPDPLSGSQPELGIKPSATKSDQTDIVDIASKGDDTKDTESGFSKLKSFWSRKPKPSETSSTGSNPVRMYAHLTYLQLPWYTIVDDILHSTMDTGL